MAWNRGCHFVAMKTLEDLSNITDQYKIVELVTSEVNAVGCADAGEGYGIVHNLPKANEFATIAIAGESCARAGGTVGIGDWITSANSGWAVKVTSGMAGPVQAIGVARSAAASGSLFTVEMRRQIFSPHSSGLIGAV